ncbi:hypothetical protein B0A52_01110 [Exophiala mesophila]|uniref:Nucleoside 2-deoxyribosyltransferase n=1 Tax=Exophiala mesophila TaxID=212818 RepID=A0A438NGI0_EXOME|nr:hypothetical protein B0A52_01110 [Exophiala mesophila]
MADQELLDSAILHTHSIPNTDHQSLPDAPKTYTYYHAGPLFTLAELHTNVLLSQAVSKLSSGKYTPVLPQDLEQRDLTPHSIRDEDLRALLNCDLALITYDGTELDAGTVVEYMVAKVADIPTVILRTDFRVSGDQEGKGDSWNLMSSSWPRTFGITVNAMVEYKAGLAKALEAGQTLNSGEVAIEGIAQKIIDGFDKVLSEPPRLPKELRDSVYHWLALMPGFRDGGDQGNIDEFAKLCKDKEAKGLL